MGKKLHRASAIVTTLITISILTSCGTSKKLCDAIEEQDFDKFNELIKKWRRRK